MSHSLGVRDTLLALLVVAILGISFVAIKFGLTEMSPLAFCAWRFLLAAIPLVFFVRRPDVPWPLLLGYGFVIGVVQFGLLFLAIAIGMPAGLSSVIIQVQVFVTIALSVLWLKERFRPAQLFGAVFAALGLVMIGWSKMASGLGLAFALVIAAAIAWGTGKVLGPRGLMPNPKLGTVTQDVATAVKAAKAGSIEFRKKWIGDPAPLGVGIDRHYRVRRDGIRLWNLVASACAS